MTRIPLLVSCLLSVPMVAAAAGDAPAALSAAQIVEKSVAASGGAAAWHAVQTLTTEGTLDAGGKENHELPYLLRLKRPHKSRLEITFKDQTSVQVFDGTQGWKVRPFLNRNEVEAYTPAETSAAVAADDLDGPLVDYAEKGTKVALAGTEAVEGHPAYKLTLSPRSGGERNLWIDAGSFLVVKADGEPRVLDGKPHKVEVFYRDYKSEHGVMISRLQETAVEGVKATRKIRVARVAVNDPLADSLFQKPQPAPAASAAPAAAAAPAPKKN